MKTAIVERAPTLGGRCLNEACIPAKAMLRAADVLSEVRDGAEFGISASDLKFDIDGRRQAPRQGRQDAHRRRRRA